MTPSKVSKIIMNASEVFSPFRATGLFGIEETSGMKWVNASCHFLLESVVPSLKTVKSSIVIPRFS